MKITPFAPWILLGLVFLTLGASPAASEAPPPLVLVLDASGSMWGQIDGENKIVIARRALAKVVDDLPDGAEVGLVAYGHRREGDCADIETLAPIGPVDRDAIKATVEALNPKGKTPITASVEQALGLVEDRGAQATVILLSDGLETCGGDPCKAVRQARESGAQMVLHVVGFGIEGEDLSQLQCLAQAGGGLFLNAESADQLSSALGAAVALPVDSPVGRLAVHAAADGELQDVVVRVVGKDGEEVAGARSYSSPDTNPTSIPLADGAYDVEIQAVGLRGDRVRRFSIEIADGETVEKKVDFSAGELSVGVRRNGALSDAVFKISVAGSGEAVASGRTYTSSADNPARIRLTAGAYEVAVESVEIAGKPGHSFGTVVVEPGGEVAVEHAFESGTLSIGAVRGEELADATLAIVSLDTGQAVARGRTYTRSASNPKAFEIPPGRYRIEAKTVGKGSAEKQVEVEVKTGERTEETVDFGEGGSE